MTIGNMFDKAENAVAIIFNEEEDTYGIHTQIKRIEKSKVSQAIANLIKQLGLDMWELTLDYAIMSSLDEEDSDNVC